MFCPRLSSSSHRTPVARERRGSSLLFLSIIRQYVVREHRNKDVPLRTCLKFHAMDDNKFYLGIGALLLWMAIMILFGTPWCLRYLRRMCIPDQPASSAQSQPMLRTRDTPKLVTSQSLPSTKVTFSRRNSETLLPIMNLLNPGQPARKTSADPRVHWKE